MTRFDQNIFSNRLKLARKMAGMSLQELSDALINKVTKQALNKYEQGLMNPTTEVLLSIADALRVKPDYFIKKPTVELGNVLFRKKASLSKRDEEKIVEEVRDYVERYLEIENILAIENKFKNPLQNFVINNKVDVEEAANYLRNKWELGQGPISNIAEMLELKGIKVLLIETVDEFDGMAVLTSTGIPIVVVNIKDRRIERIRFTIIHELAHLLLNLSNVPGLNDKMIEECCHFFSTCFLIPTTVLIKMLGSEKRNYISINELINIKESYGISIKAIVYRLPQLSVITDNYYKRWMVYMGKNYKQNGEPGNFKGDEKTKRFGQLVNRALSEEIITMSKAAALLNTDINKLRKQFWNVR